MSSSTPLYSHLALDQKMFDPASISPATHAFNQKLMDIMATGPKWYEVGAPKYRELRAEGKTPLPAATLLPSAKTFKIPSRDPGREIPCRILRPEHGGPVKGVFMHVHGGGWVLQNEASQDPPLQAIANGSDALVISIGYRLAPEDPYPAGPNDCFDAAEWLVRNADSEFGAPLCFVGGESAGGHLSMCVVLHLLQHKDAVMANFRFKGLLLHFGCYDMTFTPNVYTFRKPEVLVLDRDIMEHYRDVFLPGMSLEEMKNPEISPLYADLERLRGKLPSALFTCGTEDPLLDDTVFMSTKWLMAGGDAVVKIVPGGAHGYIYYTNAPESGYEQGMNATMEYMKNKLV